MITTAFKPYGREYFPAAGGTDISWRFQEFRLTAARPTPLRHALPQPGLRSGPNP